VVEQVGLVEVARVARIAHFWQNWVCLGTGFACPEFADVVEVAMQVPSVA